MAAFNQVYLLSVITSDQYSLRMDATPPEEKGTELALALALEVDNDDAEEQNQHSLPTADELKAQATSNPLCSPALGFFLVFVLLAAAVVGLSVGLTVDKRNNSYGGQSSGSPLFDKRTLSIEKYLLQHKVSTGEAFQDPKSPQARALNFMANADKMKMKVPRGDLKSKEGYRFITRYIMALFYYATNGARWNYDLLFLSDHDTCDWFEVFAPPLGQVGVLCNKNTNEIIGISMSKFIYEPRRLTIDSYRCHFYGASQRLFSFLFF